MSIHLSHFTAHIQQTGTHGGVGTLNDFHSPLAQATQKSIGMSEESDVRAIGALLEDEYATAILIHTSRQKMSATELSEVCDASVSTIYRRIERLQEYALLDEQLQLDRDGHHYNTYTARLERIEIELMDGEFKLEVTYLEETAADRFTDLFEGLR